MQDNLLSGELSSAISNLPASMEFLNLSGNIFTGSIPVEISDLDILIEFDVANNPDLTGYIPLSITTLALQLFDFRGTLLCEPENSSYDVWKSNVYEYYPGICETDTEMPTGTFLAPTPNGKLQKPRTLFVVDAADALSGVQRVIFSVFYHDNWHTVFIDEDGSDGWRYQWSTYDLPDQTVKVKAEIRDYAGNLKVVQLENISLTSITTFGSGYQARQSPGEQGELAISKIRHRVEIGNFNSVEYGWKNIRGFCRYLLY
jgi:hypothetical protein